MMTTARINKLVKAAIPKGKPFRVIWEPTGLGQWRILRVVTPAWKSLPKFEGVQKVRQAVEPNLSQQERDQIFRFSVLTPVELKRMEEWLRGERRATRRKNGLNGRHKVAAA